jgi:hypothetical protein
MPDDPKAPGPLIFAKCKGSTESSALDNGGKATVAIVNHDQKLKLKFSHDPGDYRLGAFLRLTFASPTPEGAELRVKTRDGDKIEKHWDIAWSHPLQIRELPLSNEQLRMALEDGLKLKVKTKDHQYRILTDSETGSNRFKPHIFLDEGVGTPEQARLRLKLPDGRQPRGVLSSCISETLFAGARAGDSEAQKDLEEHLRQRGATHKNFPRDQHHPEALSAFSQAVSLGLVKTTYEEINQFLTRFRAANGLYVAPRAFRASDPGGMLEVSTEECLYLCPALARLGGLLEIPAWLKDAAGQMIKREKILRLRDHRYTRRGSSGSLVLRSWSRGIGWFLLATALTLREFQRFDLENESAFEELHEILRTTADFLARNQMANGRWGNIIGQTTHGTDTLGTAAIAAALALVSRQDRPIPAAWDRPYRRMAQNAVEGLEKFLSPDGYLRGALPHIPAEDLTPEAVQFLENHEGYTNSLAGSALLLLARGSLEQ